jgi:hypothetical protein
MFNLNKIISFAPSYPIHKSNQTKHLFECELNVVPTGNFKIFKHPFCRVSLYTFLFMPGTVCRHVNYRKIPFPEIYGLYNMNIEL